MSWLDGEMPTRIEEALVTAEKLCLSRLVDRLAMSGPTIYSKKNLVCHNLVGKQVIRAWAKGYRVVYNGIVNFKMNNSLFLEALKRGLPVDVIDARDRITDRHLKLCKTLDIFHLLNGKNVTFCPPSVREVSVLSNNSIVDFSFCFNLRVLTITGSKVITHLPPSLEELQVCGEILTESVLKSCTRLKRLQLYDCSFSGTCPESLEFLRLCPKSAITDETLARCTKLRSLYLGGNTNISKCPDSVEILDASGLCRISDLRNCKKLWYLDHSGNANITQCPPWVEVLRAGRTCGISDVSHCHSLRYLDATDNPKLLH